MLTSLIILYLIVDVLVKALADPNLAANPQELSKVALAHCAYKYRKCEKNEGTDRSNQNSRNMFIAHRTSTDHITFPLIIVIDGYSLVRQALEHAVAVVDAGKEPDLIKRT